MKRAEMRIVGFGSEVFVQRNIKGKWEQEVLSKEQFTTMMEKEFPEYFEEYKNSGSTSSAAEWFYNYGETYLMRRKGEAFIFR